VTPPLLRRVLADDKNRARSVPYYVFADRPNQDPSKARASVRADNDHVSIGLTCDLTNRVRWTADFDAFLEWRMRQFRAKAVDRFDEVDVLGVPEVVLFFGLIDRTSELRFMRVRHPHDHDEQSDSIGHAQQFGGAFGGTNRFRGSVTRD